MSELPPLASPPIGPVDVAYMIVANNDTAAVHLDADFAAASGLPAPVAPGSFVLGRLGQALEARYGFRAIRSLQVRFKTPVYLGDAITVGGREAGLDEAGLTRLELWARGAQGQEFATAIALVDAGR